jgi:hypothetical protein
MRFGCTCACMQCRGGRNKKMFICVRADARGMLCVGIRRECVSVCEAGGNVYPIDCPLVTAARVKDLI